MVLDGPQATLGRVELGSEHTERGVRCSVNGSRLEGSTVGSCSRGDRGVGGRLVGGREHRCGKVGFVGVNDPHRVPEGHVDPSPSSHHCRCERDV